MKESLSENNCSHSVKNEAQARAHAYRMIEGAEVKASLETRPIGLTLTNEGQARALKDVPEAEREEVLKAAAETGAVTGKSITEAA